MGGGGGVWGSDDAKRAYGVFRGLSLFLGLRVDMRRIDGHGVYSLEGP